MSTGWECCRLLRNSIRMRLSVLHNLATASPCRLNQPHFWSQWWGTLSMHGALIQKTHKPTEATNTLFETSWFQN